MHDLSNESPWQAMLAPGYSYQRDQVAVVVIKAGFNINTDTGELTPFKKKPTIEAADIHQGDPLKSSLTAASETSPPKVGGEFYILNATLTPPAGGTTAAEAILSLTHSNGKKFSKSIRVAGKRHWQRSWFMTNISRAEALTPTSLGYENAYGGTDAKASPKHKQPVYLTNYAGKGYLASRHCVGVELPQLETVPFIKSTSDKPRPAGFGPVPVFWMPRRTEQGTPDLEVAKRNGCAYGKDAKATMHNSAPLDQRFPNPWQGGEVLTLTNILTDKPYGKSVSITLPCLTPQLTLAENGQTRTLTSECDTFWIDAEKNQLFMIYRAAYPIRFAKQSKGWLIVRDAQALTSETNRKAA